MDVGVGLNATIPGVPGPQVLDWAARADEGPFSSLGIIDRIAYPNHEPIATLAAVAAVTQRVRLMTTVLVAPIRNAGMLAKQAASVDSISAGRLTLGLGIGGREEDYLAANSSTPFSDRADHFEDQLHLMRRIWAGEPPDEELGPIGPPPVRPGGPELLIGGYSQVAARRAGRLGDGFIAGRVPPDTARDLYEAALGSWQEADRPGHPRFVSCAYFALGDDATVERGRDAIRHYYAFRGDEAGSVVSQMLTSGEQIADWRAQMEQVGVDELVLWPSVPDLSQLDELDAIIG